MKYMMLLYANPESFAAQTQEEMAAAMQFFADLQQETMSRGELVDTAGLADASLARTVQTDSGSPVATDGPFVEMKEVLASYAIYDLEGHDRAMDIAERVAAATGGAVEVWPVMDFGGMEP